MCGVLAGRMQKGESGAAGGGAGAGEAEDPELVFGELAPVGDLELIGGDLGDVGLIQAELLDGVNVVGGVPGGLLGRAVEDDEDLVEGIQDAVEFVVGEVLAGFVRDQYFGMDDAALDMAPAQASPAAA